ncbi:MAG: hypothetical protein QW175_01710 [Candidatus Bathyarchaeia archaeon]
MRVYSAIFFMYFCIPFAILIANEIMPYKGTPLLPKDWWMTRIDLTRIDPQTITVALTGVGGIGLIAWIFKQYVFASLAAIIWLVTTIFIPIFSTWLSILPNFIANFLPPELDIIRYLLLSFNTLIFFMFIVQLLSQRAIET